MERAAGTAMAVATVAEMAVATVAEMAVATVAGGVATVVELTRSIQIAAGRVHERPTTSFGMKT